MSTYTPDVWVVLELTSPKETIQKVFAGWYGGFAGSNNWKLNSGNIKTRKQGNWFEFDGYSGSTYRCYIPNYQMSGLMQGVFSRWLKQAEEKPGVSIRVLELDEIVVS